jgi:coproporphyrinogen III oxidase-like Fe-S oxidoreductase
MNGLHLSRFWKPFHYNLLLMFIVISLGECFQGIYFSRRRDFNSRRTQFSRQNLCVPIAISEHRDQQHDTLDIQELNFDQQHDKHQEQISIYVHIPFCRRRCRYCDFAIVPIGAQTGLDELQVPNDNMAVDTGLYGMIQNYTISVRKEIFQECTKLLSRKKKLFVRSLYFGGGTPSLAPINMLQTIVHDIKNEGSPFTLTQNAEMTIEIDPGTFSIDKLIAIRAMGFNRISLGVQSFDDQILESIGRMHRNEDIFNSLRMIKQVYGQDVNLSIDLISGLPGLSLAKWSETLNTAINLDPMPCHLSLYDLQVESVRLLCHFFLLIVST